MTVHVRDLATTQPLSRQAAAEIGGGLAKYGSPAAPMRYTNFDYVPPSQGPSIDDAANWGDDSHYYGLPPLR